MTSRITAPAAIVVSTAASAVLALCLLGGVAGGVAAQAPAVVDEAAAVTTAAVTTGTSTSDAFIATPDAGDVLYSVTSSKLADTAAATDSALSAALSADEQPGFGILGGVAAEQIPVAAGGLGPTTVVAAQANLPIAAPSPIAVPSPITVPSPIAVPSPSAPAPATSTTVVLPAIAGTPRQMAYAVATREGLDAAQWSCLSQLWQQESKFLTTVRNSRSGAYGIPQALPASRMSSAGADWRTNPVTQIRWGLGYIQTRYGTACTAWAHWKSDRWY